MSVDNFHRNFSPYQFYQLPKHYRADYEKFEKKQTRAQTTIVLTTFQLLDCYINRCARNRCFENKVIYYLLSTIIEPDGWCGPNN